MIALAENTPTYAGRQYSTILHAAENTQPSTLNNQRSSRFALELAFQVPFRGFRGV